MILNFRSAKVCPTDQRWQWSRQLGAHPRGHISARGQRGADPVSRRGRLPATPTQVVPGRHTGGERTPRHQRRRQRGVNNPAAHEPAGPWQGVAV